jgi:hypothetical protein
MVQRSAAAPAAAPAATPAAAPSASRYPARARGAPKRLADKLGASAPPTAPLQAFGRAAHASEAKRKHMRGRKGGFGRSAKYVTKQKLARGTTYRRGVPFKQVLVYGGGKRVTFLLSRRASAIAGDGLFAEQPLAARAELGFFTGVRLDAQAAKRCSAAGGKCLVLVDGDEELYLNGSRGRTSCFVLVNSVHGTGRAPNVEFVSDGARVFVRTLRAVALGEELVADYDWRRRRGGRGV